MRVVIVVQARASSTRLPGKVLMEAAGRPLLAHMIERIRAARSAERIVIATTTDPSDDAIVALCEQLEVDCFRGHPLDCLDRHYQIALRSAAEAVVKIPSDCPLIDPRAIDRVLSAWHECERPCDFLSNLHPASWPDGNDVEVMATSALACAWREADDPFDREHTTPFIWSRPARFRLANVTWESGLDHSQRYRWVVDWFEDYSVVREIVEQLAPREGPLFGVDAIIELLERRPELVARNARHVGYSHLAARPTAYASKENTR